MDKLENKNRIKEALEKNYPALSETLDLLDDNESTRKYSNAVRSAAWFLIRHMDQADAKLRLEIDREEEDDMDDDELAAYSSKLRKRALAAIKKL